MRKDNMSLKIKIWKITAVSGKYAAILVTKQTFDLYKKSYRKQYSYINFS